MDDGVLYQTEQYFQPVNCKDIECVEQDTMNSCPFHRDFEMQGKITRKIFYLEHEEKSRKERAERMGGETPAVRKVKGVLREIFF